MRLRAPIKRSARAPLGGGHHRDRAAHGQEIDSQQEIVRDSEQEVVRDYQEDNSQENNWQPARGA
jgi:hypothetical protein